MTKYYRRLLSYEKQLRNCFITKTVLSNPTTNTSQYKLRSYRLLTHAEIEFFIESIILAKIIIEKKKWISTNFITNCIANILAYSRVGLPNTCSHLSQISNKNDVSFRVNKVLVAFEMSIKRNNGIKEENIIPLIIPLGINHSSINQTLLNNLSSFGSNRGSTAHNSSKVQQLINPIDEVNMVKQIVTDLLDIDNLIFQIK